MEEMKKNPGLPDNLPEEVNTQFSEALNAQMPELEFLETEPVSEADSAQIEALLSEEEVPAHPDYEMPIPEILPSLISDDETIAQEEVSALIDDSKSEPEEDIHEAEILGEEIPEEKTVISQENDASDAGHLADAADRKDFLKYFRKEKNKVQPANPHPVKKGRPKKKKGVGFFGIPHLLSTAIWLMIIVMIGTSLGRMIWVCAADVLAFGRESKKATVTIIATDTNEDIAQKLYKAGLVKYPGLFKLYADLAVDEGDIIPGTFELDTIYDYHALVIQMGPRSSNRGVIEVLIPEGFNCRQVFALLEEKKVCTAAELEEYAATGELEDYWFLEDVERGDKYCLEGFLFPDTYQFYVGGSARHTLEKMLSGFENRYDTKYQEMLPLLNERLSAMMRKNGCSEEYIAENQLSLRDVITVASLIEEETASSKESPKIASVIYNRLTQDQEYERYLGIDATIIYALGAHTDRLTAEDLAIDSPYNTRIYAGLVPGPITNPGLESIMAALDFEDTNYYYYVLNPEAHLHDFSKTLEEHEQKADKYAQYSEEVG